MRVFTLAVVAALLLSAGPRAAYAQRTCNNRDKINCEYHPQHGWIIQGSAPVRQAPGPAPDVKPDKPAPGVTFAPEPGTQRTPEAWTQMPKPITMSADMATLQFRTLGKSLALPPMGITGWTPSGWWPDMRMQPLTFFVVQGPFKYKVEVLLDAPNCRAGRNVTALWFARQTDAYRAQEKFVTHDVREFEARWSSPYAQWANMRDTVTEFCLDIPDGALVMTVRTGAADRFDPASVRGLMARLADELLPRPSAVAAPMPQAAPAAPQRPLPGAPWELLLTVEQDRFFVDRSSLRRTGELTTISVFREAPAGRSSRIDFEAMCGTARARIGRFDVYTGPIGIGQLVRTDTTPGPWRDLGSAKLDQALFKAACGS